MALDRHRLEASGCGLEVHPVRHQPGRQDKYVEELDADLEGQLRGPGHHRANPEVFAAAGLAYDSMILRPAGANYNSVSQILQVELQNALLGKKSPQQALDDAVRQATRRQGLTQCPLSARRRKRTRHR